MKHNYLEYALNQLKKLIEISQPFRVHVRDLVDALVKAARANKLNYCVDVYPFYGSDADLAVRAGHEIRHCTMGAGVSVSHGYERSHVEGLRNTYDLVYAYTVNDKQAYMPASQDTAVCYFNCRNV